VCFVLVFVKNIIIIIIISIIIISSSSISRDESRVWEERWDIRGRCWEERWDIRAKYVILIQVY